MFRKRTSIAVVVAVAFAVAATLVLGAIAWFTYRLEEDSGMEELHEDHVETVNQMALSLALPVWNFDRAQIEKIVEGNMQDRDNYAIVVQLADVSHTVYARGRDAAWN